MAEAELSLVADSEVSFGGVFEGDPSSVANFTGADGNGNGIVDAADYVVWRREVRGTESRASSDHAVNVPELTSALLFTSGLFMTQFVLWRNTNLR